MTLRFSLHDDEDDDLRNQQWSTLNDIERQTVSNDIYVDALKCWRRCASLLQPTRRRSADVRRRRRESLHVTVVGVGGVGSHAALLLARAGVARLRLIDFDQVTLSSLNRHAVADRNDVGVPKVAALRRHIARSCGTTCDVECRVALFNASAADELLRVGNGSRWTDIVVDCIDNVDTKADLVDFCVQRNIRVVVCTGSGARLVNRQAENRPREYVQCVWFFESEFRFVGRRANASRRSARDKHRSVGAGDSAHTAKASDRASNDRLHPVGRVAAKDTATNRRQRSCARRIVCAAELQSGE